MIITWYLPFESNCTSGFGVTGLLKTRIGVSGALEAIWVLEELGGMRIERCRLGDSLLEQQHGRLERGSDSNRFCIGRPRSR